MGLFDFFLNARSAPKAASEAPQQEQDNLHKKRLPRTFQHPGGVKSLTFSPDGTLLASATADGTIKLWDTTTGSQVSSFQSGQYAEAVFSRGGRLWVVDGNDFCLWEQGESAPSERIEVRHHMGKINMCYQQELVCYSFPIMQPGKATTHGIGVLDAKSGITTQFPDQHTEPISGVAISPDGLRVASTRFTDCYVKIWDRNTGSLLTTVENPDGCSCNINQDGSKWSVRGPDCEWTWEGISGQIFGKNSSWAVGKETASLAFSTDGSFLASSHPGGIALRDANSFELKCIFPQQPQGGLAPSSEFFRQPLRFGSRQGFLVVGPGDEIHIWDTRRLGLAASWKNSNWGRVTVIGASPDGTMVACERYRGVELLIHDVED